MMHSADMAKDAAVTVRLSAAFKRRLEARARHERRSLSAQIASDLERSIESEPTAAGTSGRLLGLYEGTPVPSDDDFTRARCLLWGSLGRRRGRRGS